MSPIRCIVVDDHPAVRVGLRDLLAIEEDLDVLEAFADADAALAFARHTRVDVAIVDYQLGGHSGLWLTQRLASLPDAPVALIYSAFTDWLLSAACVVAGARGLVAKTAVGPEIADAVRRVAGGGRLLPQIAPGLSEAIRRRLDPREQAVFGMMLAGVGASDITDTLRMREGDLDDTLRAMLDKLERVGGER